jgi:hypothetical protein
MIEEDEIFDRKSSILTALFGPGQPPEVSYNFKSKNPLLCACEASAGKLLRLDAILESAKFNGVLKFSL